MLNKKKKGYTNIHTVRRIWLDATLPDESTSTHMIGPSEYVVRKQFNSTLEQGVTSDFHIYYDMKISKFLLPLIKQRCNPHIFAVQI